MLSSPSPIFSPIKMIICYPSLSSPNNDSSSLRQIYSNFHELACISTIVPAFISLTVPPLQDARYWVTKKSHLYLILVGAELSLPFFYQTKLSHYPFLSPFINDSPFLQQTYLNFDELACLPFCYLESSIIMSRVYLCIQSKRSKILAKTTM